MTFALPALIGSVLVAAAVPLLIWRSRSQSQKHREQSEEHELRSRGFDLDGIRKLQQLRGGGSVIAIGDIVLLVLLILGLVTTLDFPVTGPFLVLVVAAALIRGAVKNSRRQQSSGDDRS